MTSGEVTAESGRLHDPDWVDAQVTLSGRRWDTADRRVAATLWWYSVSRMMLSAVAEPWLAVEGAPLAAPERLALRFGGDGRVADVVVTATRAVSRREFARRVHSLLDASVRALAVSGVRPRPLWAIATDSLATVAVGPHGARTDIDRLERCSELATAIGAPLLAPRWEFVSPDREIVELIGHGRPVVGRHMVRRSSCCLILRVRDEDACASCPGRTKEDRRLRLQARL